MHATAQALLEAHTRHILQQLSGQPLDALVEAETVSACEWMASRPVNTLVDAAWVRDFLLRNVFAITPSQTLLAQIGTLAVRVFRSPLNAKTRVDAVLDAREYSLITERLIAQEELRREIVHAIMRNHEVTHIISDLVYNGVKNYLAEHGNIAKKVPGMSSLMKVGKGVMERMGSLDSALESTIKSYIRHNTRTTMDMSERLVLQALATPRLRDAAGKAWKKFHGMHLDKLARHVKDEQVQEVVMIGNALWNHFRQTDYAHGLLGELVEAWFAEWGQESLMSVLESIGLDHQRLPQEVKLFLQPLVAELIASGHLEARIRLHLETFYGSKEVKKLLEG